VSIVTSYLRRARGIVGTGATWGLVSAAAGGLLGGLTGLLIGLPSTVPVYAAMLATVFGFFGLLSGGVFATIFTILEGGRSLEGLCPFRAAAWGALAGIAVPFLLVAVRRDLVLSQVWDGVYIGSVVLGSLGSVAGTATVLTAQRTEGELEAPARAPSLPRSPAAT